MSSHHTGDGADHQQDHDLRGVSYVSLHAHGPPIHDHDVCEFSRAESAFSIPPSSQHIVSPKYQNAHPPRELPWITSGPRTTEMMEGTQRAGSILARRGAIDGMQLTLRRV